MYTLFFLALTKLQNLHRTVRHWLTGVNGTNIFCDIPCDRDYENCYCRRVTR